VGTGGGASKGCTGGVFDARLNPGALGGGRATVTVSAGGRMSGTGVGNTGLSGTRCG
jgi:hypothetical protein